MNALSDREIERRFPLWDALANLYLDTQSDDFVPLVVKAAHEGGFSLDEVEDILRWEVRPALYFNLLDVAGQWAGWHSDWLVQRILEVKAHPPDPNIGRDRFMPSEWPEIQAAMAPS